MIEPEHQRQLAYLKFPAGEAGSGLVRYGAAMHLYQRHDIAAGTLEVFRICALDDKLDPLAELQRLGLHHDIAFLKEIITR